MLRGTEDEPGGLTLRRVWQFGFPFLLFLIVRQMTVNLFIILSGVLEESLGAMGLQTYDSLGQACGLSGNGMALCQILGFLAGWLVIRKRAHYLIRRSAKENHLLYIRRKPRRQYVFLGIGTFSGMLGMNLLLELTGIIAGSESYQSVAAKQFLPDLWLGLVLYAIVAPIVEETVFRGIIFNSLRLAVSPGQAAVIGAALFGIYHGNLVQGVYGFCMGLIMIYGYEYFGKFSVPVLMHMFVNLVTYLVTTVTLRGRISLFSYRPGMVSWLICAISLGLAGGMLCLMQGQNRCLKENGRR